MLHWIDCVFLLSPRHSFPPNLGLIHVLSKTVFLVPPPQVTEQVPTNTVVHADHTPSTGNKTYHGQMCYKERHINVCFTMSCSLVFKVGKFLNKGDRIFVYKKKDVLHLLISNIQYRFTKAHITYTEQQFGHYCHCHNGFISTHFSYSNMTLERCMWMTNPQNIDTITIYVRCFVCWMTPIFWYIKLHCIESLILLLSSLSL